MIKDKKMVNVEHLNLIDKGMIGHIIQLIVQELDQVFEVKEVDLDRKVARIRGLITTYEDILRNN